MRFNVRKLILLTRYLTNKRCYHDRRGEFGNRPENQLPKRMERITKEIPYPAATSSFNDLKWRNLVEAYRANGYRCSNIDPLNLQPYWLENFNDVIELQPASHGLSASDPLPSNSNIYGAQNSEDLLRHLKEIYTGPISIECSYISNFAERQWVAEEFEKMHYEQISNEDKIAYAKWMLQSQDFDHFLASKFNTVKRYGGEGAESMMVFFYELLNQSKANQLDEIMIGMAHRGRLCLLVGLLQMDPAIMFAKMRGHLEFPEDTHALGDVLSHFAISIDLPCPSDNEYKVHTCLLPNPSHLEAVNPVVCGKARARLQTRQQADYTPQDLTDIRPSGVLPVQVHGDSAFAGQGIVFETLALSQTPHFGTNGSLHLVTNNQIGYTAEAHIARSSRHVTDLAKAIECPVFHVNGEYPEAVARATRLALKYRSYFGKDAFVNLICYRKHGHNELDDATFTQPKMYEKVLGRVTTPDAYSKELIDSGVASQDELTAWSANNRQFYQQRLKAVDDSEVNPQSAHLKAHWSSIRSAPNALEIWDTGVDLATLKFVGASSVKVPDGFTPHPHLKRMHCEARKKKVEQGAKLDWATGEALAWGSLMLQGYNIRISGQDVGRGTFSQRHCMLVDNNTDDICVPLNYMTDNQGKLEVANSLLSEEAVLGFEYGASIEHPNRLCIWEAQFGDFFNGAQTIIDTFFASGECKWLTHSALTLLLPHGYDGAGPEHTSCRIERFLQMTDSSETKVDGEWTNFHIIYPTTTAQYFHALRRQMIRPYRKPLMVIGPKILLRLPAAASSLDAFAPGTYFQTLIDDYQGNRSDVEQLILCTGKHYYTLRKHLDENMANNRHKYALIRIEQLAPFPTLDIQQTVAKFNNVKEIIWSQEEPRNMGAWLFAQARLRNLCAINPRYAGRPELPIPAVAIAQLHQNECQQIINETFEN